MSRYILLFFKTVIIGILIFGYGSIMAQQYDGRSGLRAIGTPHNPKVEMSWNRYHNNEQILDFCERLVEAYPELARLEVIGQSYLGNDILALTISDFSTGDPDKKPAFFIQANIHPNELQGTEIAMYTAWYLTENFGEVRFITDLLRDRTFYILPTINPDGRDYYIYNPNTAHSPRSGLIPFDDDGDWEIDEDGFDDLNGDGHITMMRRENPNGRWKVDPNNPLRMVRADDGEQGQYDMLGFEGIDRDGDGRINEDRTGYYDPNRDWGWNWQPDYVQGGALMYPFATPENYAVKEFVLSRPNIAGAQSYHNYGGMFLRGPGAEEDKGSYDRNDIRVYDLIGKKGEKMIPGYRYLIVHEDLYSVFGGDVDFYHGGRGIFAYVNELMTSYLLFHDESQIGRWSDEQFYDFDRYLLFGDAYVEWEPFDHPQLGPIEIGGPKKNYVRNHPGFLLEEDAHRNMAFTLYHAHQMPLIEVREPEIKRLSRNLYQIDLTIDNVRATPTHSSHDLKNRISPPNIINIKGVDIISGMIMQNPWLEVGKEQHFEPESIRVRNIPGMSSVHLRWLVRGGPSNIEIEVDSPKGGHQRLLFSMN
ncbi:MAG: peptidase M14 [Saprospirales bacterium]|nr:MAG: peptidase M14 [Saprospirales bacterium]